jgi:hypothetical protein
MLDFNKIVLLSFALFSVVVGFDLAAIKLLFPQQFMVTISVQDNNSQRYPCLFDSINKQEKCGGNGNYRIRNFSNNTFTETNYTTEFPFKCNISTNINDAKMLDPDWLDKLNLSLDSISRSVLLEYFVHLGVHVEEAITIRRITFRT